MPGKCKVMSLIPIPKKKKTRKDGGLPGAAQQVKQSTQCPPCHCLTGGSGDAFLSCEDQMSSFLETCSPASSRKERKCSLVVLLIIYTARTPVAVINSCTPYFKYFAFTHTHTHHLMATLHAWPAWKSSVWCGLCPAHWVVLGALPHLCEL